jgi:glucosyl-3-phosphoglycerate synthase
MTLESGDCSVARMRLELQPPDPRLCAVVVVPARDEVARIGACLRALRHQRGVAPSGYEVIVVLDGCRDGTAEHVAGVAASERRLRIHTLELSRSQGVGRARALGMDLACDRLMAVGCPGGLIASTDADTVVAADWLGTQLALAGAGARAIGGLIALSVGETTRLPPAALRERERRARERLDRIVAIDGAPTEHHHFSGASLSLTAQTYRDCGGLPARAALEDEALEDELNRLAIPIHRSRAVTVRTSARTDGRAPRGLALDLARADWRARRSYHHEQFPLERLLAAKTDSIALILPAREVAQTVGAIVRDAVALRDAGLYDEVLVVDSNSRDGSARVAADAGARVIQEDDVSPELGPARGKGDAMWRALRCVKSDIVAFVDTDTPNFAPHFLSGLIGPLLVDPDVHFVKGTFARPFRSGLDLTPHEGGRVTELLARPVLNLHAAELTVFDQPLAGEVAARRSLLEQIPFSAGYGVEIAMLIDSWRLLGLDALAQVDLGVRENRHQSLRELSAMAYAVLVAAQRRFLEPDFADRHASSSIVLAALESGAGGESRRVTIEERPPLSRYGSGAGASDPPQRAPAR